MTDFIDAALLVPGAKFNRWTLIEKIKGSRGTKWVCRCDCGEIRDVRQIHIRRQASKGCLQCAQFKHGLSDTTTHRIWTNMMSRCYNAGVPEFSRYGGKGIVVCDEWHDFLGFFADMGIRPDGLTLERVDNSKGYSKSNCKWASYKEQSNNRSITKRVLFEGVEYSAVELAEKLNIPYTAMSQRIRKGTTLNAPYPHRAGHGKKRQEGACSKS